MPELQLLDARADGLDGAGLRARAHELTERAGAAYAARSYRFPWALVAWHDGPVGVDLERIGPVGRSFAESIITPAERDELDGATDLDSWVTELWCSKEALAKALGDAVHYDPRRLESPTRWPGMRSGPWRASRIMALPAGHVGWLCWRSATGPDIEPQRRPSVTTPAQRRSLTTPARRPSVTTPERRPSATIHGVQPGRESRSAASTARVA
jgi:hypothetical protein